MGGCCTSEDILKNTLQLQIHSFLNHCQLINDPTRLAKELNTILNYIFFRIKIEIETALSKEFVVFDKGSHRDNNQGNMDDLQTAANLFAEINIRNKINRERLETDLNEGRVKLREIEAKLKQSSKISSSQIGSIKDNDIKGGRKNTQSASINNVAPKKQRITVQYKQDLPAISNKRSTRSNQTSNLGQLQWRQTYSFPESVLEIDNRQVQLQLQQQMIEESEDKDTQKIEGYKEQVKILNNSILTFEQQKIISYRAQVECIESLKTDIAIVEEKYSTLVKRYEETKSKYELLEELYEQAQKQIEDAKQLKISTSDGEMEQIFLKDSILTDQKQKQMMKGHNTTIELQSGIYTKNGQERQLSCIETHCQTNTSTPSEINSQLQKLSASYMTILRLFSNSKILPDYRSIEQATESRLLLSSLLEREIVSTKLLFCFDSISKVHFDGYINDQSNVLLMMELGNGRVVGGFAGEIDQNRDITDSFLFSLRGSQEVIKLTTKNTIKPINFDQNYLNFGSDELRIKARSLTLDTNISGFQCQYFLQGRGVTKQQFLGSQDSRIQIKGYELFKITFSQ